MRGHFFEGGPALNACEVPVAPQWIGKPGNQHRAEHSLRGLSHRGARSRPGGQEI